VETSGDVFDDLNAWTLLSVNLAAAIRSMDPELPMAELRTMQQVVAASMADDRFATVLLGAFATVALVLAAVGIYGVMSFVVGQRTREIGLRMALGAGRARLFRDALRDGMTTALLGTVLGSAGAWHVGRLLRGVVCGVGVMDPIVFLVVTLTLRRSSGMVHFCSLKVDHVVSGIVSRVSDSSSSAPKARGRPLRGWESGRPSGA
jgi:hypothetical protein